MASLRDLASTLAAEQLAEALPRRWTHVQAVGSKAERIGFVLDASDRDQLAAAGWLHDVGYTPEIAVTGFHPLDGARWLRSIGFDERVVGLVAHHSCAHLEAEKRGLRDVLLHEFAREESPTSDALWYADMTTGPDGQDLDVLERLGEVVSRYGPGHIVTRFIERARPEIVAAVKRTQDRAASLGQPL